MKKDNFTDILIDTTKEVVNKVNLFKEAAILARLEELNIKCDLSLERKRMFKTLGWEVIKNKETLYFNDGSVEGLRVITFVTDNEINEGEAGVNITYY